MRFEFPQTAAEFYARRDDRTNRYLGKPMHATKSVLVTADDNVLETVSGQVLLLASCNLLSRWCRSAYIDICETEIHPHLNSAKKSLVETVLEQMKDADPFGRFQARGSNVPLTDLRLHVGTRCTDVRMPVTCASSAGWQAAVCRSGCDGVKVDGSPNRIGALFAAALGAAQLFREAVGMSGFLRDRFIFDGFLLQSTPEDGLIVDYHFCGRIRYRAGVDGRSRVSG